jgi:tRNA pseudouridine55 synthase
MNGVLVIDKPSGPTSHDVVAVARRAFATPKVGHTGTLDPLATGVLPLVLGRATRLAAFLSGADKEYVAGIRFGIATDTYDAEGQPHGGGGEAAGVSDPTVAAHVTEGGVLEALETFRGRFLQTPPPYSAKKIGGTPAYKLARARKVVEIKPVEVTVHALTLVSFGDGRADVRLSCSSGFYVRSLAHDLGQRLGCGAHLESLRRTRAGDFTLDGAVPLDALSRDPATARDALIPLERLLPGYPAVRLTETGAARAGHGNSLRPVDFSDLAPPSGAVGEGPLVRLFDPTGQLVGLAESRADGLLHPQIILV